jgi:hypothetical protein
MTRREQMLALFPYTKYIETNLKKKNEITDSLSLSNKESLKAIISGPAYSDMQPRLVSGLKKDNIQDIFDEVSNKFFEYFNDSKCKAKFNEWHKELCEYIVGEMQTKSFESYKFGQAQKLVNMSFKHFYCFDDAAEKEDYFIPCHIPIDSRILNWLMKTDYFKNFKYKDQITSPWSKMEYESYEAFQKCLQGYLSSTENTKYKHSDDTAFTPLEVDFYIWRVDGLKNSIDKFTGELEHLNEFDNWQAFGDELEELENRIARLKNIMSNIENNLKK